MDNKLIINSIKKKREQGLEMLVDKYGGLITAIVRQNLNNLNNYEEECIDDILLSIWNNIDKFDESKNNFKNWIVSVSRYRVIDYKRKYLKTLEEEQIENYQFKDKLVVEERLLKNELRNEIEALLNNLNPRDKELFIKHYLEDIEIYKLAEEMGIKSDVIYNRLSRGRAKLRTLIGGYKF